MYTIIAKREFNGPRTVREIFVGWSGRPETFADEAGAKAMVRELDGEVYYLSHNESGRPTYTVHRVDRLDRRFREEIAGTA